MFDLTDILNKREAVISAFTTFRGADPFDYCVIDDFFVPDVAAALAQEFPDFSSPIWHEYNNAIEVKNA